MSRCEACLAPHKLCSHHYYGQILCRHLACCQLVYLFAVLSACMLQFQVLHQLGCVKQRHAPESLADLPVAVVEPNAHLPSAL